MNLNSGFQTPIESAFGVTVAADFKEEMRTKGANPDPADYLDSLETAFRKNDESFSPGPGSIGPVQIVGEFLPD